MGEVGSNSVLCALGGGGRVLREGRRGAACEVVLGRGTTGPAGVGAGQAVVVALCNRSR